MNFYKKYREEIKIAIITIGIISAVFLIINNKKQVAAVSLFVDHFKYIAGEYGERCYIEGHENGNIKYPTVFDSFDECIEFINRKHNN